MTAQHLPQAQLVEGISATRLLEALAGVYRWIIVTDSNRRIVWLSDEVRGLEGSGALGIGSDARDFVPKLPRPEQVFEMRSGFRRRGRLANVPLDLHTVDQDIVPVEANLLEVETRKGGERLLVAIARPRIEPLSELRPTRDADLDTRILEHSPQALVAVDAEGFVLRANPAAEALLGRTSDQIVGSPVALLFGEGPPQVERVARCLCRDDGPEGEFDFDRAEGQTLRIAVSSAPLPLPACERPGRALLLEDVTARSRDESDLRRANHELEHCVNALAHDLRSPLVALLGFSRLLRQDYGERLDDTGTHFLDRIEQAGRTMEGLIHDLLELSRIDQPGDRPSLVDPRAVLLQLKAEFKPRLDAGGISLVLPDTSPPLVYCDRTRLYQVLSNLIGNAIDHMGKIPDPRIEVSLREEDGQHHIAVRDNGGGIPVEHHQRIFEVFQSLSTRSDGRRGTGIGLAIVKKIVEKYAGRVWVESEPGAGAVFHVVLPGR
jgi:two-component system sensor kinase FixL